MSEKRNQELGIKERTNLLMQLMRTGTVPSSNAKEALRILNSLQRHRPSTGEWGSITRNPVTGVEGSVNPRGGVNFKVDGTFRNPSQAHSSLKRLGINATVNQLINEITPLDELSPGRSRSASNYSFEPLEDGGDMDASARKRFQPTNRRADLYRRVSGGAFQAHPRQDGSFAGGGIRRGETTWQPRGEGGKFSKNVQHDPKTPVRKLGVKAKERETGPLHQVPERFAGLAGAALRLNKLMIANDLVKGLTGKGYEDWFRETVESATDKLNKGEAWKPTGYTPHVGPMY